jgi:uncharacterized membrane protein YhaH (DUF805 family)
MSGKIEGHKGPGRFSFHGRAGRGEWLRLMAMATILGAIVTALSPTVGLVMSVPYTLIVLAVSSRRLHDLQLSGWLQVGPMLLTAAAIGLIVAFDQYGLADLGRFVVEPDGMTPIGIQPLDKPEPTLRQILSVPTQFGNLKGLNAMEAVVIGVYWIAMAAWLWLYGALLFSPGNSGPNAYGEADRRY